MWVKGKIHVYTGDGEGKTTTALGLALRAVGHGYRVVIVQFMKGRKDIGEYLIKDRLYPEYNIYQFGKEELVDLSSPTDEDKRLANEGLKFAKNALKQKPKLLILDEINLALAIGLLEINDVLELLSEISDETVVILTGRNAPKEIIDIADLVTEMKKIKHPFEEGVSAREGIEY